MTTKRILIDNMTENIFQIARFNQAFLQGEIGYRDYVEVEEALEARSDAIVTLDVAFRTVDDNDLESLNLINRSVSRLIDPYEMATYFLIRERSEKEQKIFEDFVAEQGTEIIELLRKMVVTLKEIHDRQDKNFFKDYHTDELIDLYSYVDIISILISEADKKAIQMFDTFYGKFNALKKLIEEEMQFKAMIKHSKLERDDIIAILDNENKSKLASYLFTPELKLQAIEIQPEFFKEIKFPSVKMMNKLKEVAPHLYTRYYPEPLPF